MARRAVQAVVRTAVERGRRLPHGGRCCRPRGKGRLDAHDRRRRGRSRAGSVRLRLRPLAAEALPRPPRRPHLPHAPGGLLLRPARGRRALRAARACPPGSTSARKSTACPTSRAAASRSRPTATGPPSTPTPASALAAPEALAAGARVPRPALPGPGKDAPLVETRVCQYENTLERRLPDRPPSRAAENVWLVGGGSGHGFKHGPAVGEYVAARVVKGVAGRTALLPGHEGDVQKRAVY